MALVSFDSSALFAMEDDKCTEAVNAMSETLTRVSAVTKNLQTQNSHLREQNARLREHIEELKVLNAAEISQLEGELADMVRELNVLFNRVYAHIERVFPSKDYAAISGKLPPTFSWKDATLQGIHENLFYPYRALKDLARKYQKNSPPQ